jgi:hypothetical protein
MSLIARCLCILEHGEVWSKMFKSLGVPSLTLRNALHSLSGAYNSGYEATAFGFRPNPRYARAPHIRKTLNAITF